MASRYDLRMEQIRADRAARRMQGEGYSEEIYRAGDEMTGHEWLTKCGWGALAAGAVLLAIFPPLGVLFIVSALLIMAGNKATVQPTEAKMYDDVRGKGATPYTVGKLLWTAFVGTVVVVGSVGFALLIAMAML